MSLFSVQLVESFNMFRDFFSFYLFDLVLGLIAPRKCAIHILSKTFISVDGYGPTYTRTIAIH